MVVVTRQSPFASRQSPLDGVIGDDNTVDIKT